MKRLSAAERKREMVGFVRTLHDGEETRTHWRNLVADFLLRLGGGEEASRWKELPFEVQERMMAELMPELSYARLRKMAFLEIDRAFKALSPQNTPS